VVLVNNFPFLVMYCCRVWCCISRQVFKMQ